MPKTINEPDMDFLFKSILSLRNTEECYDFFRDLCTIAELKAMAQRLQVAQMLNHQHIYQDIVNKTGASTATVSRVSRCFHYGHDGYQIILNRMKQHQDE